MSWEWTKVKARKVRLGDFMTVDGGSDSLITDVFEVQRIVIDSSGYRFSGSNISRYLFQNDSYHAGTDKKVHVVQNNKKKGS